MALNGSKRLWLPGGLPLPRTHRVGRLQLPRAPRRYWAAAALQPGSVGRVGAPPGSPQKHKYRPKDIHVLWRRRPPCRGKVSLPPPSSQGPSWARHGLEPCGFVPRRPDRDCAPEPRRAFQKGSDAWVLCKGSVLWMAMQRASFGLGSPPPASAVIVSPGTEAKRHRARCFYQRRAGRARQAWPPSVWVTFPLPLLFSLSRHSTGSSFHKGLAWTGSDMPIMNERSGLQKHCKGCVSEVLPQGPLQRKLALSAAERCGAWQGNPTRPHVELKKRPRWGESSGTSAPTCSALEIRSGRRSAQQLGCTTVHKSKA